MSTLHRLASRIFGFGAGLSMAPGFGIIVVNVLRRYTVGSAIEWGEELPIYLTIYGVKFGIGLAYLQDRHIRFTILTDLLLEGISNVGMARLTRAILPLFLVAMLVVLVLAFVPEPVTFLPRIQGY